MVESELNRNDPNTYTLELLQKKGREIWGKDEKMTIQEVVIRLGVNFGKLARFARGATKDRSAESVENLERELGNTIFSLIRWTQSLGCDLKRSIDLAIEAQERFARENQER